MQPELIHLFPTPLLINKYEKDFTEELNYVKNIKYRTHSESFNCQSENTFILREKELASIYEFITTQLNFYTKEIMSIKNEMFITQSWINVNRKGEHHHEHTHPNSIFSGVFYFQINEKLPPIEFKRKKIRDFSLSIDKYNNFNSESFLLPLTSGELIIFPSTLSHSVPTNNSDIERISLSFNTFSKKELGSKESLTYLPLNECYE